MAQISVIVPVYQAERTLCSCIDSILSQTYTDFELILVDDGSLDNSGMICDKYAARDMRVRVLHKENEGVSAARNSGLEVARGEYIAFVDSDDHIDAQCLEKLICANADLSICGCYITSEQNETSIYIQPESNTYHVSPDQIAYLFDNHLLKYVWGKLFRRAIVEENHLRFNAHMHLGEDTVFAVQYVLLCNSIVTMSDALYYYIKYPSNTLTKKLTPQTVISNDLRDQILDQIFRVNGIQSRLFSSANYISKQKMKNTFLAVFENRELSIIEKYKWYQLFYTLPLYVNNIEILTDGFSDTLRWVISKKSAALLTMFQIAAKFKALFKMSRK